MFERLKALESLYISIDKDLNARAYGCSSKGGVTWT